MDTKSSGPRATPGEAESARPTPGPWRAEGGYAIYGPNGEPVASVERGRFLSGEWTNPAHAANARLIASAPELAALAREIITANHAESHTEASRLLSLVAQKASDLLSRLDGGDDASARLDAAARQGRLFTEAPPVVEKDLW